MKGKQRVTIIIVCFLVLGFASRGIASRFSLFALDIQVPHTEGQSIGDVRQLAIDKGLQEAVEEATYKIIPDRGLDTTYEKLKTNIFDKARQFVPQYKILGEKTYPGTFDLSLQVTVDAVLLRRALLKIGLLKTLEKRTEGLATLEIRNLVSGIIFMRIMDFFNQHPELAEDFMLSTASRGVFTFTFIPLQPLKEIVSQILYQIRISKGTFEVVKQEKGHLILQYQGKKIPGARSQS